MSNYITEAFKQLNLLEDINDDVVLNASGITELRSFLDDAAVDPDEEMPMDIFDLEAEAKDDLKKSYEGKIILECPVCHSHIFEDKENMSLTEDGEVCPEIECPYCTSNEGYYIIGEVAPYDPNKVEEIKDEYSYSEEEEDLPEVDIEGAAEEVGEEDLEESLNESCEKEDKIDEGCKEKKEEIEEGLGEIAGGAIGTAMGGPLGGLAGSVVGSVVDKKVDSIFNSDENLDEGMKLDGVEELYDNEEIRGADELEGSEKMKGSSELHGDKHEDPINESCDKDLKEDIEDVYVTTEDETMTMTTKEDGGVVIETIPKEDDAETDFSEEEMIVPVNNEDQEIIDVAVDANDTEDEEDFSDIKETSEESEDETEFNDFDELDEFDEESFDNLGESYLKNCYENVNSFKTSSASIDGNKLIIEGMITFDSGNSKKTDFIFETVKSNNNDYKFEGYNEQISRGKKTFKLSGKLKENKLVCESLNYNYRSKNDLNESIRVYGTVRKK